MLNRTTPPSYHIPRKIQIPAPEKHILTGGIPAYMVQTNEEVLKLDVVFQAGSYYEPEALIADLTSSALKEGTVSYTSKEIAEWMDHYGAKLHVSSDNDYGTVSLITLKKFLQELLPIFYEILWQPVFPEEEIQTSLANKKQQFIIESNKVNTLAKQEFFHIIFGDKHPYGRKITLQNFEAINRDKLLAFYQTHYRYGPAYLTLTGDIPDKILPLLDTYIGNSLRDNLSPPDGPDNPEIIPYQERRHFIHKNDAVQAAIRIGKPLNINRKDSDYTGLKIANTALGGYFGSKLMKNLREEKGYTYGIYSLLNSWKFGSYFAITAETGTQVTQKALEEIYKEIHTLCNTPLSGEELTLIKNYLIGSIMRQTEGFTGVSEYLNIIVKYNLPEDYFQQFINQIHQTTPEFLMQLVARYFRPDDLYEVVAGSNEISETS